MKKNNSVTRLSVFGFFLFLFPLTLIISGALLIYDLLEKLNNHLYTAIYLILYIIIVTLAFTIIDMIRRRLMVERPVKIILDATRKIAEGDFNISLSPLHEYSKYDEYDYVIENINKMAGELSKSEILKKDFISNVSHEIKTPLSIIQNYSKALLKDNLDEKTKKKYIKTLIETTNKISNLVTNILKLNKLENEAIVFNHRKVNLGELLRQSIIAFEEKLSVKNISLNCSIDDIEQNIDSGLMEIIFNNLISNAVKFTGDNGVIDITLKRTKENIVFQVKDSGIGMKEEVGKQIFDKFYQGDESHSSEGNGLGLALVKRIIDILGGEIIVESKENKGSTFTIKLKKDLYAV